MIIYLDLWPAGTTVLPMCLYAALHGKEHLKSRVNKDNRITIQTAKSHKKIRGLCAQHNHFYCVHYVFIL